MTDDRARSDGRDPTRHRKRRRVHGLGQVSPELVITAALSKHDAINVCAMNVSRRVAPGVGVDNSLDEIAGRAVDDRGDVAGSGVINYGDIPPDIATRRIRCEDLDRIVVGLVTMHELAHETGVGRRTCDGAGTSCRDGDQTIDDRIPDPCRRWRQSVARQNICPILQDPRPLARQTQSESSDDAIIRIVVVLDPPADRDVLLSRHSAALVVIDCPVAGDDAASALEREDRRLQLARLVGEDLLCDPARRIRRSEPARRLDHLRCEPEDLVLRRIEPRWSHRAPFDEVGIRDVVL